MCWYLNTLDPAHVGDLGREDGGKRDGRRGKVERRRGQELLGLVDQGWEEREKKWEGEEMAVEEIFVPVGAVFGVSELDVEAHYCGEELGEEED